MIFQDLVIQIQTEGRIRDDDAFIPVVLAILNESFKEAVESQRPFELRNEVTLALTAQQGSVPVPTDFFIHHQVFFEAFNGQEWQLTDQDKAISPAPRGMYGKPKQFEIQNGLNIILKPAQNVTGAEAIKLIYYQLPPIATISNITSANPIPRLEPFLIRCALRRVRMYHSDDLEVAKMLDGDIASAAKGYSNDGPERNSTTGA